MNAEYLENITNKIINTIGSYYEKGISPLSSVVQSNHLYSYCGSEDCLIYNKLRSLLISKISYEIFGEPQNIVENLYIRKGVLMMKDYINVIEGSAEWYWDNENATPLTSFFWKDSIRICGNDISCEEDLYDYYLTEESRGFLNLTHSVVKECKNLDEIRAIAPYTASAVNDVMNFFKEPYKEEMAFEYIRNGISSVMEDMTYDESTMFIETNVNVAIKPFVDFIIRNHKVYHEEGAAKLAVKMIRSLRYPTTMTMTSAMALSYGFTENLFYNSITLGDMYDDSLLYDDITINCELSFMYLDYLIAYLDTKYNFLSSELREYYCSIENS